ncbi:hypothetical protein [Emticicia sp. 17c]|uniref:hypothetical protein n=1 Tax=Emticicia sp. 17c TaxID=3127704 RepID=UPI00301C651C
MAQLAFEHARSEKNILRKALLSLGGRNEIIHCEFLVSGMRLSAWQSGGVQIRPIGNLNLKDFLVYELGYEVDAQLLSYFEQRQGSKYDTLALLTDMIGGLRLKRKDQFFCSEICYEVLKNELGLNLPSRVPSSVSPQELYAMLEPLHLKQIYL